MSDHEFEKKVQSSLEQLRLRPSVAVWAEVERNIRRDKRRRRMIMWLPVCLLFLGAGGYFMLQGNHSSDKQPVAAVHTIPSSSNTNTTSSDNTSTQAKDNTAHTGTNETAQDNQQPPVTAAEQQQPESPAPATTVPQPEVKTKTPAVINKTNPSQPLANNHRPVIPDQKETSLHIKPGRKKKPAINNAPLAYQAPETKQDLPVTGNDTAAGKETVDPVTAMNDVTIVTDTAMLADNRPSDSTVTATVTTPDSTALAVATPADSVQKAIEPVKQPETQAIAAIKPQPLQRPRSGRWQWGVQADAGFTGITQKGLFGGLFNFLSSNSAVEKVADLSSSPNFYSSSNGLSMAAPQFPRPVNRASEINMGPSFGIGGFVQRTFSKRFSLSVGLQYAYLTTRTVVGSKVDSFRAVNRQPSTVQLVNSYYDANNTENYSNKYHFIEIPVTLHTQLNKSKRLPLVWDVGFSASYMIGTTALHYDGLGGVYYKDNTLFNKMQWVAATGFNIGLFQKAKHPLSIGPSVRYNMTNLLQKDYNTGQHLWSVGLKATVLLKK